MHVILRTKIHQKFQIQKGSIVLEQAQKGSTVHCSRTGLFEIAAKLIFHQGIVEKLRRS